MRIVELDDHTAALAHPAMRELRPSLTDEAEFVERVRRQRAAGYRLVARVDEDEVVVAAVGFRFGESLSRGKYVYIDDLCTLSTARNRGHATALLTWVENEAQRLGCRCTELDSGMTRHAAHRRYLGFGYDIFALHFVKPVDS